MAISRKVLMALLWAALFSLASCAGIQAAAELGPDEKGAACITIEKQSDYPAVNGVTRAAILEINTGDPNQAISPELIAQTAEAMGCR